MCCSVAKDNSEDFFWMAEDALTETAIKAVSYKIAVSKKAEKSIQTPTWNNQGKKGGVVTMVSCLVDNEPLRIYPQT